MKQWEKEAVTKAFQEMLEWGTEWRIYHAVSVEDNKRCAYSISIKKLDELPLFEEFYPGCGQISQDQEK